MRTVPAALAALFVLALASGASAAPPPQIAIRGDQAGGGPSQYQQSYVQKYGPATAKRVLILVPGFQGGSGDFALLAPEIVARVPNLQVWAYDRRSQALEDSSAFKAGDPDASFDYYLGGKGFKPINGSTDTPYARGWGLKVAMNDLHAVVQSAAKGGRQVILGGHSLGGSITLDYASWDFNGRAGYKDLTGLVLIDGGGARVLAPADQAKARSDVAALNAGGEPFAQLLGGLPPWSAGVFAEQAALAAKVQPNGVSRFNGFALLPDSLKPPYTATNESAIGFAFDVDTSPSYLGLTQIHSGMAAAEGDPRPWVDGGITPIQNLATAFSQEPGNATEWYFPNRLSIDVRAAGTLTRTKLSDELGLRTWHGREVNLPLYGFQTALSKGSLFTNLRFFLKRSKIKTSKLVDRQTTTSHLDPLLAAPAGNDFLTTVVPFLKSL